MKRFVIFLILLFSIGVMGGTSQVSALCVVNKDWSNAPCFDQENPNTVDAQTAWEPYYDHKGELWMGQKKIELMIAIRDNVVDEWIDETMDISTNWNVYSYFDAFDSLEKYRGPNSPAKQLDYGFGLDNIKCKENLVLIQKYDGSPACVKPSSIPDLIKRNWTTTEMLLDMPLVQLGKECGHYSHNEFFSRMQNHTLDTLCHDFIVKKALDDEKKMLEQGYLFDAEEQIWKMNGFPDVMMSISYHYVMNLELENES